MTDKTETVSLLIAPEGADPETAGRLREKFPGGGDPDCGLTLQLDAQGLSLRSDGQVLTGDYIRMLPRLKGLSQELLVRAARIKDPAGPLTAIDATAGLGEDSLLLAAAGFRVTLYERNPVVFELLTDAWQRALRDPELAPIAARMQPLQEDSIHALTHLETPPDVVFLDPMFPERQKSALVKKKLQMIQKLEIPCPDEKELFLAAVRAKPKKLIIKRPPKGPYLAGIKPDYAITGKAVRFDCFAAPYDRLEKFQTL